MGDVVKGRTGVCGRAWPPPEGERPFTATNKPACSAQPASTGPLVGPSRIRFHWATRSTMTWRLAGWGLGSSGGVGGLTCLAVSTSLPRRRRCPFVAPVLTARVGSQAAALSRCTRLQFSKPGHETFGLLLAPAQTWLSSFCDLRGDVRGEGDGAVCPRTWPSERSGALGGLETSGPCRDRAFGQ